VVRLTYHCKTGNGFLAWNFSRLAGRLVVDVASSIQFRREIVADNLRRVRQALGLSLRDLAKLTGISHSHILKIETGQHDFQIETLGRLALTMGVPCGLLMDAAVCPSSVEFEQAILKEKFLEQPAWRSQIPAVWSARERRIVLQFGSESCVLCAKVILATRARTTIDRVSLPPVPALRDAWSDLANRIDGTGPEQQWLHLSERYQLLHLLKKAPLETLSVLRVFWPQAVLDYVNQRESKYKPWVVEERPFNELF
jgi:transcriptional regulator with XRE-family HTH domain